MRFMMAVILIPCIVVPTSASLEITNPVVLESSIPNTNDFQGTLTSAPLNFDHIVMGGVNITAPGTLKFYIHASESGYVNTFTVDGQSIVENVDMTPFHSTGILFATVPIAAPTTLANLNAIFTSNLGDAAPVGDQGFGIFALKNPDNTTKTGPFTRLYFGYDDNGANKDDNHDDLIVSMVFEPVPEAASLVVWSGLLCVGLFLTRAYRNVLLEHNEPL